MGVAKGSWVSSVVGDPLGKYSYHFGTTLRQLWDNFGTASKQLWDNFETIIALAVRTLAVWAAYIHFGHIIPKVAVYQHLLKS